MEDATFELLERTTVALESIAASMKAASELKAWESRSQDYCGVPDGVCTARAEYMGRSLRCCLPFDHMGNHATNVPGGEMRWTLVVSK